MSIKKEKSDQSFVNKCSTFEFSLDHDVIIDLFINYQHDNNCDMIEVNNIPSLSHALNIIYNPKFKNALFKKFPSLILIKLEISQELFEENFKLPNFLTFDECEKILMTFESSTNNSKVFFWKNSINEKFQRIFANETCTEDISQFIHEFLLERLRKSRKVSFKSHFQTLSNLIDSSGYNLLMSAIEQQNTIIIDELLKFSFDWSQKTSENSTAADIAWNRNDQRTLLKLLRNNSIFPRNFSYENCNEEIKNFIEINKNLKAAVEQRNIEKIKQIINCKENKILRHFYDINNQSIIAFALEHNYIDIYDLLLENNIIFGPFESNEIPSTLENDDLKLIRDINSEHSINLTEFYIYKLLAFTVIFHDNLNFSIRELSQIIKEVYFDINSTEIGKLLLQIVATSSKIKIHFDFNQKSVMSMDPTQDPSTSGLCYYEKGNIYVGAIEVLEPSLKNIIVGVLMHEICHFALHLVFRNDCKPYSIDDVENREKFEQILKSCEVNKNVENIVELVFSEYSENLQIAELAVRVPHMFGHYQNDQEKLTELKQTFAPLFQYFDEFIKPSIFETIPILEKISKRSSKIKYEELTKGLKSAVCHSELDFQGLEMRFKDFADDEIFNKLSVINYITAQNIYEILNGETLCIGSLKIEMKNFI